MKSITDYILNESSTSKGYVVTYKKKDSNDKLDAFLIETDDNLKEFADKIYKNDLAKDYFRSLLNSGMSSGSPRTTYKDEFIEYLSKEGVTEDHVFSIMLPSTFTRLYKSTPKVASKFEL